MTDEEHERRERVPIDSLRLGPIRREKLSDEQSARLRRIHETLAGVDGFTYEQRELGFLRDANPDRELDIWEAVANVFSHVCGSMELTDDGRRDVYSLLLMRTMSSSEDVLKQVKREALSDEEARSVLDFVDSGG